MVLGSPTPFRIRQDMYVEDSCSLLVPKLGYYIHCDEQNQTNLTVLFYGI